MKSKFRFSNLLGFLLLVLFQLSQAIPAHSQDKGVMETSGTAETTRNVNPQDVVVPPGLKIEAVSQGLTYPVDVTLMRKAPFILQKQGGHTYGTKPEKAPDARILKRTEEGQWEVVYDKLVPMDAIKNVPFPTRGKLPEGLFLQ